MCRPSSGISEENSIPDKSYVQNLAIDSQMLPAATGGDGALTYAFSPDLPAGLTFDPATRLLSGMPCRAAAGHSATPIRRRIAILGRPGLGIADLHRHGGGRPHADLSAGQHSDRIYDRGRVIDSETLPAATSGDGELTYTLSPDLPAGLTFDPETRLLSGIPTVAQPATLYTYTVTDSDTEDPDSASLTFSDRGGGGGFGEPIGRRHGSGRGQRPHDPSPSP